MRGLFTILLVTVTIFSCWANNTIEQLEQQVQKAQSANERVDAQNALCKAYLKAGKHEEAAKLLVQNEQLAQKSNYLEGQAACLDIQGDIYESKYDYTNAMTVYMSAMGLRTNQSDNLLTARSHNNIGRTFLLQGEHEKAIEELEKALKIREEQKDISAAAETHQLLGDAYIAKNRSGSAKNHYKRALDLKIQLEELSSASQLASKLGQIESKLGAYDSALVYYNTSLDLNSSIEDLPNIAKDYEKIAQVHFAQDETEEAIEANNIAKNIWKDLDNNLGLANVYKSIAQCRAELDDQKEAERNLEKSISYLKKAGNAPETHQIYKAVAGVYESLGEYKKAYQYHNAFAVSKEAFFSQEKSRVINEINTKYESRFEAEKKQQMITQLEMDKAASRKIRSFLIALLAMIGALAATLYYSYRQKKKDNIALQERNEKIEFQKSEIDQKNIELKEKNVSLDILNGKLVDEMAERESIEQSSFARDRFLATMSHEMRTPMNAIVGLTHLLLDEKPRENQVEHMRNLLFSANNLTVFINDILDFSKIEAGKLTLDSRQFNPKKIFDEMYFRFKKPVESQNVSLNYEFDNRIPNELIGDPARINQIVNNLLSNSLQKTTEGAISLKVYLDEYNTQDVMLKMVLTDTGKGLSKKDLEKMFHNYWEDNGDIYEGYERSQMGLAMAKRLVDLQNGKIEVDTAEGKGTTFNILIPCKQVQGNTVAPQKTTVSKQSNEDNTLENRRILVVEDNKINQLVVAKLLRNLGAKTETVDNGKDAVELVKKEDFDLILMDIQMPIMDGYKATAIIRDMSNPQKKNIPIIALTASAFLSETEKAKLFGMNDHVGKPFGPEDLLEKITACLAKLTPHSSTKTKV